MTAGLGLLDGLFCMLDLEHLPAALCHCKAEVQPPEHDLTFPVTGQDRRLALMSLSKQACTWLIAGTNMS